MGFLTDFQLKKRVAAALHVDPGELEDFWDETIQNANTSAYNEIRARLLSRGFTLAQINGWERGGEFQGAIGTYHALIFSVTGEAYDDKWPEKLKWWRDELLTADIVVDGELENPTGDDNAYVGHGDLSTVNDIFVLPTDGRGDETEW